MQTILKCALLLLLIAGTATAGTWCLKFDGIDDWVEITESPLDNSDPGQGFTCEGWMRVNLIEDDEGADQIFYNGPFAEFGIAAGWEDGPVMDFGIKFTDIDWQVLETNITTGEWFHFAAVYDRAGSQMRLYVNGVLEVEQPLASTDLNSWFACGMGAYAPDLEGSQNFNGWIDAIRITEGPRYTSDFTPPLDFVADFETMALWSLEAGAGDYIEDVSGHIHDGVNHGATWVLRSEVAATVSSWGAVKTLYSGEK